MADHPKIDVISAGSLQRVGESLTEEGLEPSLPRDFRACRMCRFRWIRCSGHNGQISLPLYGLWLGLCGDCYRWLVNEDGVLIAGLVILREQSRHILG